MVVYFCSTDPGKRPMSVESQSLQSLSHFQDKLQGVFSLFLSIYFFNTSSEKIKEKHYRHRYKERKSLSRV